MERLILAVVLVIVAIVVAGVVRRRRPDAPTQARSALVPQQLDRTDFSASSSEWLIVVFSSDTCEACDEALSQAEKLAGDDVHVQEVSWQDEPDLHRRYSIETVPLIAIAGPDGAVGAGFVGPPAPTELQAALSRLRNQAT